MLNDKDAVKYIIGIGSYYSHYFPQKKDFELYFFYQS